MEQLDKCSLICDVKGAGKKYPINLKGKFAPEASMNMNVPVIYSSHQRIGESLCAQGPADCPWNRNIFSGKFPLIVQTIQEPQN